MQERDCMNKIASSEVFFSSEYDVSKNNIALLHCFLAQSYFENCPIKSPIEIIFGPE